MKKIENKIIVFANQKGGVGKSTLCMLLADYMAYWKLPVTVIDSDIQSTITDQRNYDVSVNTDKPPYDVQQFDICAPDVMQQLMDNARKAEGFVLFDTPGNIKEDGMAVMLGNADYIVCPFKYQRKTIASTETFIKVVEQLRSLNPEMKAKLFFVPNFVDRRIGTKEEWKYYKEVDAEFSRHGILTPEVGYRAIMERANTFMPIVDQKHAVYPAFKLMTEYFLDRKEYSLNSEHHGN